MATLSTADFMITEPQKIENPENILSFEGLELMYTSHDQSQLKNKSLPVSDVKNHRKSILSNLTGHFRKGLNAILGSSGSGKTSFLNSLAQRIINTDELKQSGTVQINGKEYGYQHFNSFAGYVMQNDYLLPYLTVNEYFKFAADMKLTCSEDEKRQKINKVINLLNLSCCQNSRIGDSQQRGISGGERKRVSIGLELIAEPKVLFLDEPTSGLDSFTSYQVMKILKDLSEKLNQTIVFTIHQPSSDIWSLFDRITILAEGQFIYQGSQDNTLDYFSSIGYRCPIYNNPADYLMYQLASENNVQKMIQQYKKYLESQIQTENKCLLDLSENDSSSNKQILQNSQNQKIGSVYMLKKLIQRQKKQLSRNSIMVSARFFQICVMALFTGAIYWQLSHADTYEDTKRAVFLKEEGSNLYTTWTYFLSKILLEIISCSLFAIFDSCIVYWMIGFSASPSKFFFFVLIQVLQSNIGNAFGVLAGSLFKQEKVCIAFSLTFYAPQILFAGIFKNRNSYMAWVGWIQYLTPTMYAFDAVAQDQYSDSQNMYNPIEYLNLDINKWHCVIVLVALYFIYNGIAFGCLFLKRQRLQ